MVEGMGEKFGARAVIGEMFYSSIMSRVLCLGGVAIMLAALSPAQAQPVAAGLPPESTIEAWLLSGDPRLVAWGAHYALIAHDENLIPELLDLAGHWQPLSDRTEDPSSPTKLSPEQTDERDSMAAILDALIQMNAPVSANTMRALAPDFGNVAAVLLSRMPPDQAGSLSLEFYGHLPERSYALRYVSAALLALHPLPGFAADLLANIKVQASILVVAPGQKVGMGVSGGSCYQISETARKDWPVTGQYVLSMQHTDGALLVVAGVDPIYAKRELSTRYLGDSCRASYGVTLGPTQRLRLIAEMLGIAPEAIQWQTSPVTNIEFYSLEKFYNAVVALVAEQQAKYRATAVELAAHNLLTSSEAHQILPELVLHLSDERGAGADPIPSPSNLPAHVEWNSTPC